MKCPVCQTEMETGGLLEEGNIWTQGVTALNFLNGILVHAFRCPKCGKIELTSEVKE